MSTTETTQFTTWLAAARNGDEAAANELFASVYRELHQIAKHYLRSERPSHTLQPTALVHEVYLRLFAGAPITLENRAHFFAIAARQMRRILIDYARRRQTQRNGGEWQRISLAQAAGISFDQPEDLLALDEALQLLTAQYPRAAQVVELRYFAGLPETEVAELLGISPSTLKREWSFAKVWLLRQLSLKSAPAAEESEIESPRFKSQARQTVQA